MIDQTELTRLKAEAEAAWVAREAAYEAAWEADVTWEAAYEAWVAREAWEAEGEK